MTLTHRPHAASYVYELDGSESGHYDYVLEGGDARPRQRLIEYHSAAPPPRALRPLEASVLAVPERFHDDGRAADAGALADHDALRGWLARLGLDPQRFAFPGTAAELDASVHRATQQPFAPGSLQQGPGAAREGALWYFLGHGEDAADLFRHRGGRLTLKHVIGQFHRAVVTAARGGRADKTLLVVLDSCFAAAHVRDTYADPAVRTWTQELAARGSEVIVQAASEGSTHSRWFTPVFVWLQSEAVRMGLREQYAGQFGRYEFPDDWPSPSVWVNGQQETTYQDAGLHCASPQEGCDVWLFPAADFFRFCVSHYLSATGRQPLRN